MTGTARALEQLDDQELAYLVDVLDVATEAPTGDPTGEQLWALGKVAEVFDELRRRGRDDLPALPDHPGTSVEVLTADEARRFAGEFAGLAAAMDRAGRPGLASWYGACATELVDAAVRRHGELDALDEDGGADG